MSAWLSRAIVIQRCRAPVPLAPLAPIAGAQRRRSAPIGANDAIGTAVSVDHGACCPRRSADDPAADESAITAADWLAQHDERATIPKFEGGLSRPEAEWLAQADTVTTLGPQPSQSDGRKP